MSSAYTWIPSSNAIPYITATFALLVSIVALMSFLWRRRIDFSGKHCYIGGGSEGLGLALACLLVERGAHVSIVSRSKAKLDAAIPRIETHRQSPSQHIASYACDLTLADDAAAALNLACGTFGSAPDFVFACAGGAVPGLFADLDAERHWQCLQWNFKTALCTIHEATRRMQQEGRPGQIVLTASILAMMGFAGYSSYTPSKYAIRGTTPALLFARFHRRRSCVVDPSCVQDWRRAFGTNFRFMAFQYICSCLQRSCHPALSRSRNSNPPSPASSRDLTRARLPRW
ncbi:hypothetical protein, variant [Microbotryum lychnidis-dioicae p1A1 Lamole]|uniref:Uncharacterized protein n=1 Tax=Microbotryum lychnidis-dioicae (strain p1A1 Lamole / MvSl-1064) TaxID=683840 RepID=U5H7I7_USTV1|nr:hypothetical protein, variant [Microbotryum lychnidis-dioicae p1A1 Lamole]|eukprot:KDE06428.1 hypothetical protein, variant [Microbotryum lychnidis-dioicae p1A1 Lamole]